MEEESDLALINDLIGSVTVTNGGTIAASIG